MEKDNIIFAYELQLKKNESGLYEIVYEKLSERSGNYSNSRYKSIYEVSNGKLIFVNAQNENYSMIEKMTYNLLGKSSFLNIYFLISIILTKILLQIVQEYMSECAYVWFWHL